MNRIQLPDSSVSISFGKFKHSLPLNNQRFFATTEKLFNFVHCLLGIREQLLVFRLSSYSIRFKYLLDIASGKKLVQKDSVGSVGPLARAFGFLCIGQFKGISAQFYSVVEVGLFFFLLRQENGKPAIIQIGCGSCINYIFPVQFNRFFNCPDSFIKIFGS